MKHARVKLNYLYCGGDKLCACASGTTHQDGHPVAEFLMIEDERALREYADLLKNAATQQITKCINSRLFPEHVDHMLGGKDMGSQLLAVAYYTASAHQITHPEPHMLNNPLYHIELAAERKIELLHKMLREGKTPIINPSGGFMWLGDGIDAEVVETYDKHPDSGAPKNVLRKGSKVVVLENDWELPKESSEYLTQKYGKNFASQGNFSIVYDLRGHSHEKLVAFLKELIL